MRNLITYEEISQLARPCTTDRDMAEAMIAEAQRVELKPRLGDALYLKLIADEPEERFKVLLEGGEWKSDCGDNLLTGIKTALAYYALARIVRDGNIHAIRLVLCVREGALHVFRNQVLKVLATPPQLGCLAPVEGCDAQRVSLLAYDRACMYSLDSEFA